MDNTRASPQWAASSLPWILFTLLAFGLRLHRIDFQPLWGDEGWSFYFASLNLGDMVRLTAEDIHPPLYYALLGGWLRLAGSQPAIARFLSILIGTLLVPISYRAATRLSDRFAGLMTAAVVTWAPLAIYYSQEVRMYGTVTLLGVASLYFFSRHLSAVGPGATSERRRDFWGYILATTAALYTMYYAFFILAAQFGAFLAVNRRRNLRDWIHHPFVRSLSVTILLYLPWALYAGAKLVVYVQGKRTAEGYLPLGLADFIVSHVIAFSLGHLSDATQVLAWAALVFVPVALLGLLYRPSHLPSLLALYLLIPLLLGYLVNRFYPFTPRYFERTLLLAAPAWWMLLGAGLAWLWRCSRLALVGAAAAMALILGVMLLDFYRVPRYRDEDYRALMAYVGAHSNPDDVFLASYQWQAGFYYAYLSPPRPSLYLVPGWGEAWAADPARMHADLDALVGQHSRLWFPAYQALGRQWETQAESYLNRSAFPVEVDWTLPSTKLLLYARGEWLAPAAAPINFADRLLVEGAEVGDTPAAGQSVLPVTLVWRKLNILWNDHRVSLRLADASGRTWASRDSLPQGGTASFVALRTGERLLDRHGLAIPAGTPPGVYQLRLGLYDQGDKRPLDVLDGHGQPQGTEAVLATVQVILPNRPLPAEALPIQHRHTADFEEGVRLLGYSLGDGPFRAGDSLSFSLFWQSLAGDHRPYIVFAQLQDDAGKPVALSETPSIYPSERWPAGLLVRDPREIPLPAALPAGTYRLAVGLLRPDGSRLRAGDDDQVVLTTVDTTQRSHDFSPPTPEHLLDIRFGDQARLAGYDLQEEDFKAGESLKLVLYWQAVETLQQRYTVFVHLVDAADQIVGQRDQVPGKGEYPTTSWIPGEYLADPYILPVNPNTSPGDYRIEVGLYNPLDDTRLPVTTADGSPIGDRLLLPEALIRINP